MIHMELKKKIVASWHNFCSLKSLQTSWLHLNKMQLLSWTREMVQWKGTIVSVYTLHATPPALDLDLFCLTFLNFFFIRRLKLSLNYWKDITSWIRACSIIQGISSIQTYTSSMPLAYFAKRRADLFPWWPTCVKAMWWKSAQASCMPKITASTNGGDGPTHSKRAAQLRNLLWSKHPLYPYPLQVECPFQMPWLLLPRVQMVHLFSCSKLPWLSLPYPLWPPQCPQPLALQKLPHRHLPCTSDLEEEAIGLVG